MNRLGVAMTSPPRGVMTDRKARANGVGGEVPATCLKEESNVLSWKTPDRRPRKAWTCRSAEDQITVKGCLGGTLRVPEPW